LYFGSVIKILSVNYLKQLRVSVLDYNKIKRHRKKTLKIIVTTTKLNMDCIIHILGFTYPLIQNQNKV
jgi:hypothetical protein